MFPSDPRAFEYDGMTSLVFSKSRQTVPVLLLALAGFFTIYTYHITGHPDLGDQTQLAADMMV